jgi:flagellar motility protein MotE (MotC chaperone)
MAAKWEDIGEYRKALREAFGKARKELLERKKAIAKKEKELAAKEAELRALNEMLETRRREISGLESDLLKEVKKLVVALSEEEEER